MMLRPRLMLSIGLAIILILGLCTALAGQAMSMSDYTLSTADGLSLSLSADGQITHVQTDGDELVSAPAPALLLRDLSDAGQVSEPNLVANPGFEDGLAGWVEATNSGVDVSIVVSPTHGGTAALRFSSSGERTPFAAYASDPLTVTAGQRYRVSAWWRSARGYVTQPDVAPTQWQMGLWRSPPRSNGLYVQWLDADSHSLGNPQLAVPLHWNATRWRIARRELMAPSGATFARLIIGAKVEDDSLWVDDLAFVLAPEPDIPLTGTVGPCPQSPISNIQSPISNIQSEIPSSQLPAVCLSQTIPLPEAGLVISVTYTAHDDHIAVQGEVMDTAGRNRALDLTWGVPLNAQGWIWWDDAHTSRTITDTSSYANAISAIYDGWLPMSLYPYAGIAQYPISNTQYPISNLGLALALPLARPQLALLSYDGAAGRYGATFHLGISPQADKVGPRATFDLLLYRFDPAWGFRDVMARHRAIQPEAYTTDLPIYDYEGRSQGQYYSPTGALQVQADDAANVYSAQYTVGEFHVRINPDTEPKPDMDQILQAVTDTLQSSNQRTQANFQALLASSVMDTNGDWSVKKLGSFPWSHDLWEMIWAGNVDPDIENGLGQFMLNWLVDPAFQATEAIGAHLDGVQIDNFQATPAFDLRPEAIAAADTPLGYTPHTYQPAVHTGFAFREYLAFLRQHLDANWGTDRGITINFWGLGNPNYLAPFLDAMGSEGNLKGNGEGPNWNPEILNYRRAIAYSRPYLFANQMAGLTASEAYTFTQLALLYGVAAGPGPNAAGWEPGAQQIISDTHALVTRYWAAGWEPLTYARADSEDVWIERFGPISNTPISNTQTSDIGYSVLFFPIHNRTTLTRTAAITIETTPLGITDPTAVTLTDIAITQTIPFSVVDGNLVLSLALGPWQSRVLQVSGGESSASPIYLPLALSQWHAPPTPPDQPASGPGGRDYPHASYVVSERGLGNGKYWVYQPADPRPETAPVVVFLHGWGALSPDPYQFWLEHLVRKGNIVIYPKYQATRLTPPNTFTQNAIGAVKDALDWLERNPGRVQPDRTKFAILGHSYGGVITVNMAHRWQTAGLPQPGTIMPMMPGTEDGGEGNIDPLSGIPSSTLMNCYVGNDDQLAGRTVCDIIWDRTGQIPPANRDYVVMYSDHHGEPGLDADHGAPTGGPGFQEVDALDWYGFWKDFDALRDCAFYGANCPFGVGDTPEHRFMGFWSDGTLVRELQITDTKP